jgi:tyrosine ammonia-lyase
MGTIGARRTQELLGLLYSLLAIEVLMVAQAVDLRLEQNPDNRFGESVVGLLEWVRRQAPRLTNDRPLHQDIERLAGAIQQPGTLADQLGFSH